MGASYCGASASAACPVVAESCRNSAPSRSYRNARAVGRGGPLVAVKGRVVCVVVAYDYEGYPAEEHAGCGPLHCVASGRRFADLAGASGAEVIEFYDQPSVPGSQGFPHKDRVLAELRRVGQSLGAGDALVFYFAGHGAKAAGEDCMSASPHCAKPNDELCFVTPSGFPDFLRAGEVAELLSGESCPQTRVLFITDCCRAGNICDLTRGEFVGRPMCHLAGARTGEQGSDGWGDYCAFTGVMLETVRDFVRHGESEFSVIHVFNACFARYEDMPESQEVCFERTLNFDPDTFAWPLVPTWGWEVGVSVEAVDVQAMDVANVPSPRSCVKKPGASDNNAKAKAARVHFDMAAVDCIRYPIYSKSDLCLARE